MNYGIGNQITPFRGRSLDFKKPVRPYRNLHGDGARKFSIQQEGLVVGHTNQIMLRECAFLISHAGQARVRRQKSKNVHAFIVGFVCENGAMGGLASDAKSFPEKVKYNPYTMDTFRAEVVGCRDYPIKAAPAVMINPKSGITTCYSS